MDAFHEMGLGQWLPAGIVAAVAIWLGSRPIGRWMRDAIAKAEALHPAPLEQADVTCEAVRRELRATPRDLDPLSLEELSAVLLSAESVDLRARTLVVHDRQRRKASWLLQTVDLLSATSEEALGSEAESHRRRIHTCATQRSAARVRERAAELATATPDNASKYKRLLAGTEAASRQCELADSVARLATDARDALREAERRCSSASTTEFFDMLSTSKLVSVMSSSDNSEAQRAVERARGAVRALQRALPDRTALTRLPSVPEDLVDLVVDLTLAPGLDLLSFCSMLALDNAVVACRRAANALGPVVESTRELASTTLDASHRAAAELASFEAPFVRRARNELPRPLQALVEHAASRSGVTPSTALR